MNKNKIAIIGAGPAGLAAAYTLSKAKNFKNKFEIDLYEAGSNVGGMCQTIELWNQSVDIGPHRFFSNDTRVNKLWLEIAGKDYQMVDRLTRIYYNNKFFDYPIKPANALINLGIIETFKCISALFKEIISPTKDENTFESWVTKRFGSRLYQIFFKTYSEKLWGIPCSQLDADFAAQRIKKFTLVEAILGAFKIKSTSKHKTLVDQFAYPSLGTGMIYQRMSQRFINNGGKLFTNKPIKRIIINNNTVDGIELSDGTVKKYDRVISSMPISIMIRATENVPNRIKKLSKNLKFRNTILVYLNIDANNLFPDNWLYIHSDNMRMGRVTNFRNWSATINKGQNTTILALEYWCNDEDPFWNKDDEYLIKLAKKEIKMTGLVKNHKIIAGSVYRVPKCYPIYGKNYRKFLEPIEEYFKNIEHLQLIGRYGSFKYNNQDHSLLMGYLAANNIINNLNEDLWDINTDYEEYQENSTITATGLQNN